MCGNPEEWTPARVTAAQLAAQAWCDDRNAHKEMDTDLATTIAELFEPYVEVAGADPVAFLAAVKEAESYLLRMTTADCDCDDDVGFACETCLAKGILARLDAAREEK